jgi:LysM repeat protein
MSVYQSLSRGFKVRVVSLRRALSLPILVVVLMGVLFGAPGLALADFSYTVKAGDNLSKIAKNNGTTIEALVAANKTQYPCLAKSPACLQIGWVITIPGGGSSTSISSGPSTYTVVSGDSLAKIAKKLGVDFNAFIAANKDRPCLTAAKPCSLQIGWVLHVPGGSNVAANDPKAPVIEYFAAINARDVERFKATIHPDILAKWTDVDKDLHDLFVFIEVFQIKYEITDLQVIQQNETSAIVTYSIKATSAFGQDSGTDTGSGKFLLVKYQGQWKILDQAVDDLEAIK